MEGRGLFMVALSAAMTTAVLLNTSLQCGAVGPGNATVCHGEGCLIAHLRDVDADLEFQMPTEISRRILAKVTEFKKTTNTGNPNKYGLCGGTTSCTGPPRGTRYIPPRCGNAYQRGCKKK